MTYLVDGKAPGQFRARCRLTKPHPVKDLPEYLRREYAEKGWPKGTREIYSRKTRREVSTECFLEPLCEGFETSDPAAFDAHMKTAHGKGEVKGYAESWLLGIRKGWRPPRLSVEGKPLVKAAAEITRACPFCGLIAEVSDRAADLLWWDEHERGCTIAHVARSAS